MQILAVSRTKGEGRDAPGPEEPVARCRHPARAHRAATTIEEKTKKKKKRKGKEKTKRCCLTRPAWEPGRYPEATVTGSRGMLLGATRTDDYSDARMLEQ